MQTRHPFHRSASPLTRRACAIATILALAMGASACSTPRVAGRAESERRLSACESAYLSASSNSDRMNDTSTHIVERYLSARQASYDWIETATQCSARFGEGTMRGAQSRHIVRTLATRLGIAVDPVTPSRLDDVSSLDLDDDSLSTMAEAEDAAGFATEILAARSNGNVSLDLSDRHKTTSQRLISLAGNDDDHRDKVYDAATLLANPDTMVDGATGLKAPTGAVIEMNCARSEISAVAASSNATGEGTSSNASRKASLGTLAALIADRAELALYWGYPAFDEALFD